jgi:LysM repeat protein
VLLAAALLVTLASLAHDPEAPLPASWGTVSVSQNATLWSIAEAHPVEGRSTVDTVELIAAENNLADCTIHAGQVLRVPASQPSLVLVQR